MEPQRPNTPRMPEELPTNAPESIPQEEVQIERHEQVANPEIQQDATTQQIKSVPLPSVSDPDFAAATQKAGAQDDGIPLIADDVDVIEKVWVDKAKEILERTKDDPYVQEEEIEKLQVEYLKQRYGKEIKKSE